MYALSYITLINSRFNGLPMWSTEIEISHILKMQNMRRSQTHQIKTPFPTSFIVTNCATVGRSRWGRSRCKADHGGLHVHLLLGPVLRSGGVHACVNVCMSIYLGACLHECTKYLCPNRPSGNEPLPNSIGTGRVFKHSYRPLIDSTFPSFPLRRTVLSSFRWCPTTASPYPSCCGLPKQPW